MSGYFVLVQAAASLPEVQDPVAVMLLGAGLLGVLYFMFLRPRAKKAKRRQDPLSMPATQRRSLADERASERQMQSLVLDLEQLARRMGAQLDTKAAKLDALIREADAKATALSAALAKVKAADLGDAVAAGHSGPAESGLAALGKHRDIYRLADSGEKPHDIARRLNRPAGEVELILALRGR